MGRTEWRGFDIIFHPTCKLKYTKALFLLLIDEKSWYQI